jgi:hypothetical protein
LSFCSSGGGISDSLSFCSSGGILGSFFSRKMAVDSSNVSMMLCQSLF